MVKVPISMVMYEKNASKMRERLMMTRCKRCKRPFSEGGLSGTPSICAKCMRGDAMEVESNGGRTA